MDAAAQLGYPLQIDNVQYAPSEQPENIRGIEVKRLPFGNITILSAA